jgi:hypothetical protein
MELLRLLSKSNHSAINPGRVAEKTVCFASMKPKVLLSVAWGPAWALIAPANAPGHRRLSGPDRLPRCDPTPRISSTGGLASCRSSSAAEQSMKRGALVLWVCGVAVCSTYHAEPPPLRSSPDTTVHLRMKRSVDSSRYLPRRKRAAESHSGPTRGVVADRRAGSLGACAVPSGPSKEGRDAAMAFCACTTPWPTEGVDP